MGLLKLKYLFLHDLLQLSMSFIPLGHAKLD